MTLAIGIPDSKLKKKFAKKLDKAYHYALKHHLDVYMIRDAINENELTEIILNENTDGILISKNGYFVFEKHTE